MEWRQDADMCMQDVGRQDDGVLSPDIWMQDICVQMDACRILGDRTMVFCLQISGIQSNIVCIFVLCSDGMYAGYMGRQYEGVYLRISRIQDICVIVSIFVLCSDGCNAGYWEMIWGSLSPNIWDTEYLFHSVYYLWSVCKYVYAGYREMIWGCLSADM